MLAMSNGLYILLRIQHLVVMLTMNLLDSYYLHQLICKLLLILQILFYQLIGVIQLMEQVMKSLLLQIYLLLI